MRLSTFTRNINIYILLLNFLSLLDNRSKLTNKYIIIIKFNSYMNYNKGSEITGYIIENIISIVESPNSASNTVHKVKLTI